MPPLPKLSESRSEASEPTGEGESNSDRNLLLLPPPPPEELDDVDDEVETSGRLNEYELLLLLLKIGGAKSLPKRKADAACSPDVIGENGLAGNKSSEKKVFIDVGDSLSEDGGDGESAVDPFNFPPPPPRCWLFLVGWGVGGGELLLRASSAL